MSSAEDIDRYRAPALDKGLDIIELLAGIEGGLTQAEIAKALGRTPNEFYRMLDRLVRRGYVSRSEGDRFELTLKLFALAHLHAPIRRLVALAAPLMRDLAARTMQANHLAIYDKSGVTVIAQVGFAWILGYFRARGGTESACSTLVRAMCCLLSAARASAP